MHCTDRIVFLFYKSVIRLFFRILNECMIKNQFLELNYSLAPVVSSANGKSLSLEREQLHMMLFPAEGFCFWNKLLLFRGFFFPPHIGVIKAMPLLGHPAKTDLWLKPSNPERSDTTQTFQGQRNLEGKAEVTFSPVVVQFFSPVRL